MWQEHTWFCSSRWEELIELLFGLKSPADVAVLKSRLACFQMLIVHALKVRYHISKVISLCGSKKFVQLLLSSRKPFVFICFSWLFYVANSPSGRFMTIWSHIIISYCSYVVFILLFVLRWKWVISVPWKLLITFSLFFLRAFHPWILPFLNISMPIMGMVTDVAHDQVGHKSSFCIVQFLFSLRHDYSLFIVFLNHEPGYLYMLICHFFICLCYRSHSDIIDEYLSIYKL